MWRSVKAELDRICASLVSASQSDKRWTRDIKEALVRYGKERRYWVYASEADGADGGEWLFDLCWLNYSGDQILDVELAMESEWGSPVGVLEDFQKLCVCKAQWKLMIFQARTQDEYAEIAKTLHTQLKTYARTERGDQYLLSCWVRSSKAFIHEEFAVAT